jgi:hypothetical protein
VLPLRVAAAGRHRRSMSSGVPPNPARLSRCRARVRFQSAGLIGSRSSTPFNFLTLQAAAVEPTRLNASSLPAEIRSDQFRAGKFRPSSAVDVLDHPPERHHVGSIRILLGDGYVLLYQDQAHASPPQAGNH